MILLSSSKTSAWSNCTAKRRIREGDRPWNFIDFRYSYRFTESNSKVMH
jgi:hypothetical protein